MWSSSFCNFLHDPSSSLLGQNIFLNTLFSKSLPQSERPSFAPIQHNLENYCFVYFNIYVFLIWDGKTKDFGLNNSKHSQNLIYSWFHHECHSDLLVSSSGDEIYWEEKNGTFRTRIRNLWQFCFSIFSRKDVLSVKLHGLPIITCVL
jgi:hypothetical protein